ncbi:FimV/HubP family polar landmark protein [Allohahella marinimesophila]|uniref:Motility hub landmark protein FimV n=1 Tax=Allohahella marinimesophila TaxID=1054972 RepID=A0ABP7NX16_9GAMM
MVRKFAVALFAASSLSASIAQALGLGEVTVNSSLNQPLDAQIELVNTEGLQPSEIVTALASQEAFRRANIDRAFFLNDVRFKVEWKNTGNAVIRLTSSKPVREPYLNFLVEVNWPSGRLLREYALLIDPPTYSLDDTTSTAPVQAAQTNTPAQQPTRERETAQPRSESGTASQQPARTTVPASTASQGGGQADAYGPIRSDETMWEIALKTRPNSQISPQQMMLAIQDLNPDAFVNNNINLVKRGQMLQIPDEQTILERDRRNATSEFAEQNREFEEITGTELPRSEKMRILADDRGTATGSEANSGEGQVTGTSVRATDPVVLGEDLAEQARANEELKSRLDAVQEQLATAQRLVKLKDDELAALQAQLAQARAEGSQAGSADQAAPGSADGGTAMQTEGAGSDEVFTQEEGTTEASDSTASTDDPIAQPGEGDQAAEETSGELEGAAGDTAAIDSSDPSAEMAAGDATDGEMTDGAVEDAEAPVLTEEIPVVKPRDVAPPAATEPESLLDQIASNPLYQMALGGGLLLILLLLWAMSRRKANKDADGYDEVADDAAGPSGAALAASRAGMSRNADDAASDESDPVAAADVYLAYDREDQARQVLEDALEKEPNNQRYRLKLLEVLGMAGATVAMQQAYDRIMAGEDEDAIVEAQTVMNRYDVATDNHAGMDDADDDTSLEALEEELRNSSPSPAPAYARTGHPDDELSDDDLADVFGEPEQAPERSGSASSASNDIDDLDTDSGYDAAVNTPDSPNNSRDLSFSLDDTATSGAFDDSDDLDIDFRISDLDLDDADDSPASVSTSSLEDEADLLDLDSLETVDGDKNGDPRSTEFDRSLQAAEAAADEINASLEEPIELDSDEDVIDLDSSELDLELSDAEEDEVTDFDLELDEEDTIPTTGSVLGTSPSDKKDADDLDLADLDMDDLESVDLEADEPDLDDLQTAELDEDSLDIDSTSGDLAAPVVTGGSDSDLADDEPAEAKELDDDFDFMSDADEAATKLDLARAYLDMGDKDGARDILLEVVEEGSDEQKTEANELLAGL